MPDNQSTARPSQADDTDQMIDFGYRQVPREDKQALVADVFSSVAPSYDLMNDLMSAGIHRLWKDALMDWMAPRPEQSLVDLAGGTGDIALRFLKRGGGSAHIIDINADMLEAGKNRTDLKAFSGQLEWTVASAESIPLDDNSADRVTIAFGLRNVTDRMEALAQAYRILKPGGRFCCLEFSHISQPQLSALYDIWSFNALPRIGRLVAGDEDAYRYLAESIRQFPDQHKLMEMMAEAGFAQIRYRNLSQGIAAIHSGWKLD